MNLKRHLPNLRRRRLLSRQRFKQKPHQMTDKQTPLYLRMMYRQLEIPVLILE
jgi:hypothetical protein